ncbi:MAG: fasciclin domain-containing protein [Geobacteraceae bacterium]|nr:fasciclin domain-containing protein [Geobacteraceae bacterium]
MADIMDTLRSDATLKTLVGYLEEAKLTETLKGAGPYTLFAPNNEAFVRMNIAELLKDPKTLKETLTYHLAAGKHSAKEIGAMDDLGTENGKSLTINLDEGDTVVDNAKFVTTDIECSNGLIHIIDNVFQPSLSGWYRDESG